MKNQFVHDVIFNEQCQSDDVFINHDEVFIILTITYDILKCLHPILYRVKL